MFRRGIIESSSPPFQPATWIALAFLFVLVVGSTQAQTITLDPSAAKLTAPFALRNDYIVQEATTNLENGGRAEYKFSLTAAGTYAIRIEAKTPSEDANSCYVEIDAEPTDPASLWEMPVTAEIKNLYVTAKPTGTNLGPARLREFKLDAGKHRLVLVGCEANTELGQVTIQSASEVRRPKPPALRVVATD